MSHASDKPTFEGGVPMTPEGLVASNPNAIWTVSDRMVEPLAMTPEMVNIEDVAYALSNAPRFTGHVKRQHGFPFTVAQHSVLVAGLVWYKEFQAPEGSRSWNNVLYGLVHDASEAYLSDMARPIKHYNNFGDLYREIENGLMQAVAANLGLAPKMPDVVKWADDVSLRMECRDFMGETMRLMYAEGNADVGFFFPDPVVTWSHEEAFEEFLAAFHKVQDWRSML